MGELNEVEHFVTHAVLHLDILEIPTFESGTYNNTYEDMKTTEPAVRVAKAATGSYICVINSGIIVSQKVLYYNLNQEFS